MKKIVFIPFLFLIATIAFGQNKVLVFYDPANASEAKVLWEDAHAKKVVLDTLSNPARFTETNLKDYRSVVFLNTSINRLSFRQSAELQRFMQAGGGFVGVGNAAEKTYKWLWYRNMLGGTLAETQLDNTIQLSIITNASLGKTELPPLWKVDDKPLLFNTLPVHCKPILLDVMGKTWAWYYTTEEGGKMFYTALGVDPTAYQNGNLISHIWTGIEEVSSKTLLDYTKIAETALPSENNFLKITLTDNLQQPLALAVMRNDKVLLVEQDGSVKLYDGQKRKTNVIGKTDNANLKAIKLDPEFNQNGYVYTFSETKPSEYKIGRIQIAGDSLALPTDFSSQSTTPLSKNILYDFEKYDKSPYRLPKYFDAKTFRFDNEQGLILETFDEDGNVKNVEPFLSNMRFNFIQDMSFGGDGALYFLENNQLHKIDYSTINRKPIAIASADVLTGNMPLKVKFSSDGSIDYDKNDVLSFQWDFGGLGVSQEPNPEFVFTKVGIYDVKLKVMDTHGDTAEKMLKIEVKKGPVKRK